MGISCLLYRNKLAALTSNALPEALAARVERHLHTCPDCLSEWAAQQRMADALRGVSPELAAPSPFLWERLQSAIEAETAETEVRAPARPPLRRLAPLGGLALAGAAAAAILVLRPQTAPPTPTPAAASPAPVQVAKSQPSPSPAPTALELAQKSETQVAVNTPAPDPFAQKASAEPDRGAEIVRRVRSNRPTVHRPKVLPVPEGEFPTRASNNAVALVEAGMHRVVEESQTEELNRLVAEAEQREPGASQRASCPATEATVSAQHTQGSLFQ